MENAIVESPVESSLIRASISKLVHSPLNVRKKQPTGIAELAVLIFSQGLIHNLAVVAQIKKNKPKGKFEVIAGSRRPDALLMLVADGRYSKETITLVLFILPSINKGIITDPWMGAIRMDELKGSLGGLPLIFLKHLSSEIARYSSDPFWVMRPSVLYKPKK